MDRHRKVAECVLFMQIENSGHSALALSVTLRGSTQQENIRIFIYIRYFHSPWDATVRDKDR